jgi:hypothetical protein
VTTALLNHLRVDDLDRPFGYRCRPPYYWESSPLANLRIVPLWECDNFVNYFNLDSHYFERCRLEDINNVLSRFHSIQGLLAELFIDVYEDELDILVLSRYADLFGFNSLSRLINELGTAPENYQGWRLQFCTSCC